MHESTFVPLADQEGLGRMMKRKIYALCIAGLVFCSGCGAAKNGKEPVPEGVAGSEDETAANLTESEGAAEATEGTEQTEAIGEQDETEQAQVAANTTPQTSAGYETYRKLLQEQLDYMIAHPEEYDMDAATIEFALLDVDRDGREELLIAKAPYVMAGMSAEIYDYNPDTAELYLEFSGFPAFAIYDNGVICEEASHNQGKGEKLWPYSLHKYDAAKDIYSCMAYIDSWDKELVPDGFPEAVDVDGDGTVYYINEGEWTNEKAVDNAVYEEWLAPYMAGAEEVAVTWTKLTEENIENLIPAGI